MVRASKLSVEGWDIDHEPYATQHLHFITDPAGASAAMAEIEKLLVSLDDHPWRGDPH